MCPIYFESYLFRTKCTLRLTVRTVISMCLACLLCVQRPNDTPCAFHVCSMYPSQVMVHRHFMCNDIDHHAFWCHPLPHNSVSCAVGRCLLDATYYIYMAAIFMKSVIAA